MIRKKLKILLILSNFYSDSFPSWPEIVGIYGINFPKKGHEIIWVMPYKCGIFNKVNMIDKKFPNVKIFLIPFTKSSNIVIIGISFILYYFRLLLYLPKLIKKDYHTILQVRDDIIATIISLGVKFYLKIIVTFNYSFPIYEGFFEKYKLKRYSFFLLMYRKFLDIVLKNILLKKVDYVFPISTRMIDQLSERGINKEKMYPIDLGVEPSILKIDDKLKINFIKKYNLENDFIFIYIGTMTKERGIELVIKSFKRLIQNKSNVKLLLVGDVENYLQEMVNELNLEKNVIFTGRLQYLDVPYLIDISYAGLSIIKPLDCFFVSSPCKLFEYMFLKKPVLANIEIPENKNVIESSNGGLLASYNLNDIYNKMKHLIENPLEAKEQGNNGYDWVIENRTFSKKTEKIEKIYNKLLSIHYKNKKQN